MSLKERKAAYEASLLADAQDAVSQPKLGPVADAPPISLARIQSAYTLSAAALNSERGKGAAAPKLARAHSSGQFIEPPPTEELLETILACVARRETSWVDLTFHGEFTRLSQKAKSDIICRLAEAGEAIEILKLNSVGLDNSNAAAVAQLIRGNRKLHGLQLEGNLLTEPGLLEIAEAVHGHRTLSELSLASQKAALSTAAISRFIDAMEATPSLVSCNLGHLRDDTVRRRHQAANMANVEAMRQRRVAARSGATSPDSGGPVQRRAVSFDQRRSTPVKAPAVSVSTGLAEKQARVAGSIANVIRDATVVADWEAEARRVRNSEMFEYGHPSAGSPYEHLERGTAYVATGSVLWSRASLDDQLAVIRAFASNTTVRTVVMVNIATTGAASDALAKAWAEALKTNSTITMLNLESNGIQSEGIIALGEAVALPTCGLLELRLANQRLAGSQAAEEKLAEGVAQNRLLRTVTIDARSNRARELIIKTVNANIDEHRRAKRSGIAGTTSPHRLQPAIPSGCLQGERQQEQGPITAADLRSTELDPLAHAAGPTTDAAMTAQLSRAKPAAARRPARSARRRVETPAGGTTVSTEVHPPACMARPPPSPPAAAPAAAAVGGSIAGAGDGDLVRSFTWSPSMKTKDGQQPKVNIGAMAAEAGSRRLNNRVARMPTVPASPRMAGAEVPQEDAGEVTPAAVALGSHPAAVVSSHVPQPQAGAAKPTVRKPPAPAQQSAPSPEPSWAKPQLRSATSPHTLAHAERKDVQPSWVTQPRLRSVPPPAASPASNEPCATLPHNTREETKAPPDWTKLSQLRSTASPAGEPPQVAAEPMDTDPRPSWAKQPRMRSVESSASQPKLSPSLKPGPSGSDVQPSWVKQAQLRSTSSAASQPVAYKAAEQGEGLPFDHSCLKPSQLRACQARSTQFLRPAPSGSDGVRSNVSRPVLQSNQATAGHVVPAQPACQPQAYTTRDVPSRSTNINSESNEPSSVSYRPRSVVQHATPASTQGPSKDQSNDMKTAPYALAQTVSRTSLAAPAAPPAFPQKPGAVAVPKIDDLVRRYDTSPEKEADPFPSPRKAPGNGAPVKPRMKLRNFSSIFNQRNSSGEIRREGLGECS